MPEESRPKDLGAAWREQPEEKRAVILEHLVNRRTRELYSRTRLEILASVGAPLFFLAVIAWRFASIRERVPPPVLAAVAAWVLISLYWFRHRIRRQNAPRADSLAATGLEYYRKELERRRAHLGNAWLWHGPLLLACVTLALIVVGTAYSGFERLRNVAPVAVLLAVWTGLGIRRRRRQVNDIQREIEEIDSM